MQQVHILKVPGELRKKYVDQNRQRENNPINEISVFPNVKRKQYHILNNCKANKIEKKEGDSRIAVCFSVSDIKKFSVKFLP